MQGSGYPGPKGQPSRPPSGGSSVKTPRDWHAERYAAAAELAKASGLLLDNLRAESLFNCSREHHLERLSKALAEYERTKNAP